MRHGDDPLLIVAGAGTGKTTTLARRVAFLIATNVQPNRILLLTFTRRAAAELRRRVDGLLNAVGFATDHGRTGLSWNGTFHSIANRLLRKYGTFLGLPPEFTLLDRGDSEDLMNVLRGELGFAKSKDRFPLKGTCVDIYSRCVNKRSRLEDVLKRDYPTWLERVDDLKKLFQTYVDRKEQHVVLDYDDLLVFWHALLADPDGGPVIREQFDAVLVDEYQDTNMLQAEVLSTLRPDGHGMTVVGDDAQSIYSFRAATVRNILEFPDQFPAVKTIALEWNYRSTSEILDATNVLISHSTEWHPKTLKSHRGSGERPVFVNCKDEGEQTEFVADQVLERREEGIPLSRQAVLFRASYHSASLELELSRRKVPFHKYGGLKFIETAHVKDLLAILRLAENPRDLIAGTRALLLLPGIGATKASSLMGMLAESAGDFSCWAGFTPPKATADYWDDFNTLLRQLMEDDGNEQSMPTQINRVRTFYGPLLERLHDHATLRMQDLEQLENISSRFPNRGTFLADVALDPPSSTSDLGNSATADEDFLVLSTIHSAKGLEWDTVYLIHASEGSLPSDMAVGSAEALEEERRLCYVALTRAENRLVVCHPQRNHSARRAWTDGYRTSQRSQFLSDDVMKLFERKRLRGRAEETPRGDGKNRTEAVRKRLNSLWD